jgi:tetratricopeptide (TPR) repeat protein
MAVYRRGHNAIFSGDWERAQADLALAMQMAPHSAHEPDFVCTLGLLSLVQGAWADASARLEEAAAAHVASMGNVHVWAERLLAELDLLQERPAVALARLQAVLDREGGHDVAFMLPYVALAHLQLGAVDEAEAVSTQAVTRATTEDNRLALADALRVQALVVMERQRWEEAARVLEEGLALTRRIGYRYAEGRLLHVYGLMYRQKGEAGLAREQMEAALTIFRRLGAGKDAERAEQAIAGLSMPHP